MDNYWYYGAAKWASEHLYLAGSSWKLGCVSKLKISSVKLRESEGRRSYKLYKYSIETSRRC